MVRVENPAGRWIERCIYCGGEWLSLMPGEIEKDIDDGIRPDVLRRLCKKSIIQEQHESCSDGCGEEFIKLRKCGERFY